MKPGKRPAKNKPYQVTAEIFKGRRVQLSSSAFLGSNGGSSFLPFQRESDSRLPIKSIKTVSVPQMIGNPTVQTQIQANIEDGLSKRVEHHFNQAMKKHGG
jgi:hypothetical protein